MIIDAHIVSFNEEKILPFILDYYSKICRHIYIYDNMSDDSSDEIYKRYPKVKVFKWSSNDTFITMEISNIQSYTYRKFSRDCDWVITCDCDEIVYHKNLIKKLEDYTKLGVTIPKIDGRDMVSYDFPKYDGLLITDKIKTGSKTYKPMCKRRVFNPKINIQYGPGAHDWYSDSNPNDIVESDDAEIKLLHYKLLGKDYVSKMYERARNRRSQQDKQLGFGTHYLKMQETYKYMDDILKENIEVI